MTTNNTPQGPIDALAKAITAKKLADFYADPKNMAAFEAWLKERETGK